MGPERLDDLPNLILLEDQARMRAVKPYALRRVWIPKGYARACRFSRLFLVVS